MWCLQIEGVSLQNHQQEIITDWNTSFSGGKMIGSMIQSRSIQFRDLKHRDFLEAG